MLLIIIFKFPNKYDQNIKTWVENHNYLPLLKNDVGEIISYIGFDDQLGYELVLPICKNKEQLIDDLLNQYLPEIMPDIFPESQEFAWINSDYFKCKKILELERNIKELNQKYQEQIKTITDQILKIERDNMSFKELLTETGNKLVKVVDNYLKWLGFSDVLLVDEIDLVI